jgi:hypothetical protein
MKSQKFAGREGRGQAKLPDIEGYRRVVYRRPLVWLLASAVAVLATAAGLSAERAKSASAPSAKTALHPKKAGEAEHHKDAKQQKEAEHHKGEHGKEAGHNKAAEHHKGEPRNGTEHHKEAEPLKPAEHHKHVIVQPAGDEAAAPLSPDLAAVMQAVAMSQAATKMADEAGEAPLAEL